MSTVLVRRAQEEPDDGDVVLDIGATLITGTRDFEKAFGPLEPLEIDLLVLGAAVFAADRALQRGEREELSREIELRVPAYNAVTLSRLAPMFEAVLYRLSYDSWTLDFRQEPGVAPPTAGPAGPATTSNGRVLLFSGGLDSLAAAVEFHDEGLTLVSHRTRNRRTGTAQESLATLLSSSGLGSPHHSFFVSSRNGGPTAFKHDAESSQRTRSFLFLCLAALVARRVGSHEVLYMAENGQMAIHLALTPARIGAFSTHTAHPDVLQQMSAVVSAALGATITFANPYVHKTKAEVVEPVVSRLPDGLAIAHSCWRNSRLPSGVTHCGECIPCFVRRIALETHTKDPTAYGRDIWNEDLSRLPPEDIGRRNISDLCEFVVNLGRLSNNDMLHQWPELFSPAIDANEVISMYRRFAQEAHTVLSGYGSLVPFLT